MTLRLAAASRKATKATPEVWWNAMPVMRFDVVSNAAAVTGHASRLECEICSPASHVLRQQRKECVLGCDSSFVSGRKPRAQASDIPYEAGKQPYQAERDLLPSSIC